MTKHIAIYMRVSSRAQNLRSQRPDLQRWAAGQTEPIKWYSDQATGKNMERPGWQKLQTAIDTREVSAIVVWRLDRIGRTARGLTSLFADLQERGVKLVSLKEGLDLSTPSGRLMAQVLSSIAEFESEIKGERIRAGQAAARAAGKTWGGGKSGRRVRLTLEKEKAIKQLHAERKSISEIARVVGLSRPTVYKALE